MKKAYTTTDEIRQVVRDDYESNSTELNSLLFDFDVKDIKKKDLLEIYKTIQSDINGDFVVRLKGAKINKCAGTVDCKIFGELSDLIHDGEYDDTYSGNLKDFLESFNGRELETGLCRVIELEEVNGLSGGIKLDFIF